MNFPREVGGWWIDWLMLFLGGGIINYSMFSLLMEFRDRW